MSGRFNIECHYCGDKFTVRCDEELHPSFCVLCGEPIEDKTDETDEDLLDDEGDDS